MLTNNINTTWCSSVELRNLTICLVEFIFQILESFLVFLETSMAIVLINFIEMGNDWNSLYWSCLGLLLLAINFCFCVAFHFCLLEYLFNNNM